MHTDTTPSSWREILGRSPRCSIEDVRAAFRALAMRRHPDHGGTDAEFHALVAAYRAALASCASAPPADASPPPADHVTVLNGRLVILDNGQTAFLNDGSPAMVEASGPTAAVVISQGILPEFTLRASRGATITMNTVTCWLRHGLRLELDGGTIELRGVGGRLKFERGWLTGTHIEPGRVNGPLFRVGLSVAGRVEVERLPKGRG